jgi:hypothetical protein
MVFQLIFAGPIIWAGWAKGRDAAGMLEMQDYQDDHQKVGLALLILYVIQLVVGFFIHFVKMPLMFGGHRPPQNYVHIILGIVILALAAYQVRCPPPPPVFIPTLTLGLIHLPLRFAMVCGLNGFWWKDTTCLSRLRMRGWPWLW